MNENSSHEKVESIMRKQKMDDLSKLYDVYHLIALPSSLSELDEKIRRFWELYLKEEYKEEELLEQMKRIAELFQSVKGQIRNESVQLYYAFLAVCDTVKGSGQKFREML